MNTLILAILLLSGYVYVINSATSRYKFKRAEGWGAYFYVAMWGGIFTVSSWIICSTLNVLGFFRWVYSSSIAQGLVNKDFAERLFPILPSAAIKFVDLKFAIFGLTAVVLPFIWARLVLRGYRRYRYGDLYKYFELEAVLGDHPHELKLISATVSRQPVLISMASRKFYVGLVVGRRLDGDKTEFLPLLPLMSGYRDKDTLVTNVTTNYKDHYIESGILDGTGDGNLTLDDFEILIAFSEIESISSFDIDAYIKFKEQELIDNQ